ncbi:hypothetical protein A9266_18420 [Vibrio tasmaniensis]|nr:hypothetical protein A9266_18420 [Vibrio tasmaniensis]
MAVILAEIIAKPKGNHMRKKMKSFNRFDTVQEAVTFLSKYGFVAFKGTEAQISDYKQLVEKEAQDKGIETIPDWHQIGKGTGEITDCFYYIYNYELFTRDNKSKKQELKDMLDKVE